MSLPPLLTLVYLSITLNFTCARVCDVKCPAGRYYDQENDGCRPCSELCTSYYEGRVVDCNNLCRTHCNFVTTRGDEKTKCFSATVWEDISEEHSLPCSKCCAADNQVCSQQMPQCEDCTSFCRADGGDLKSCQGYCQDWCDTLNSRDWTVDEEEKYGLCHETFLPLQLLDMYKKYTISTAEPTHEEITGSAEGPDDDDEDNRRGNPENQADEYEDSPEIKAKAKIEVLDKSSDMERDGGERKTENKTTTKRIQFQPGQPSETVVKLEESFSTRWLLWIIGGCAILLLLVNGILLVVMLKQRTKPPESHQSATHTNNMYGTSTADEEKKKLIPDIESQSSESMGGGSRSRCESEKTNDGDTADMSQGSEVGVAAGNDKEGEEEREITEVNDTYSYIDPQATVKASDGSTDVV